MSKVLAMVRASTEKQSIEDQKKELIGFCKDEGYSEEDIIIVEDQGASASKVNEKYQAMIAMVKSHIENNPDINCFAVWHFNRAFRNELVYVQLKTFLVEHKVQMMSKNPYLKLLNADGSINEGFELAIGLLAILAKQDNEERIEKFKRSKNSMKQKGMYIGGHTIKFGYRVDENQYFVPDETDSKIVQKIYELYATGNYSIYSIFKELESLGIKTSQGTPVLLNTIQKVLIFKSYTGKEDKHGIPYPQIISDELYEKSRIVAKEHLLFNRQGIKEEHLASTIGTCYKCGCHLICNSKRYVCVNNRRDARIRCDNSLHIKANYIDSLLLRTASILNTDYLVDLSENKLDEYKKQLEDIEQKLATAIKKMEEIQVKKNKVAESYIEGLITREKKAQLLVKIENEATTHKSNITRLNEAKNAVNGLINKGSDFDYVNAVLSASNLNETLTIQEKRNIIRQFIKTYTAQPISYGIRDPRTTKDNGILITIKDIYGNDWKYLYIPCKYEGHNLYVWEGSKFIPDAL